MSEYAKIDTLFDRGADFKVDVTRVRRPEFAAIDRWRVDEKLDGMNIRLILRDDPDAPAEVRGRTDRATVPDGVRRAATDHLRWNPSNLHPGQVGLVVYGEGLGPKVNGNPHRLDHCEFRVFDVRPLIARSFETGHVDEAEVVATHISYNECLGRWLERVDVRAVAVALGLAMVPEIAVTPRNDIVWAVRVREGADAIQRPDSPWRGLGGGFEGVVCRPLTELRTPRGDRVVWKLKVRDF